MKFFLDSAKIEEIDYAYKKLGIDGVTTNPRHINLSGKTFKAVLQDLTNWVELNSLNGKEKFPISIEINPHISEYDKMVECALEFSALCDNFVIKIPCTEEGIIASRILEKQGIRTNVTLVFSPSQALMVFKSKAMFVSPFVGWKENSGEDCNQYIRDIIEIKNNYGFKTEIIVAALRNGKQIVDAAVLGADIVTCGLQVYRDSFEHPFTNYGLNVFKDAWDKTAKE